MTDTLPPPPLSFDAILGDVRTVPAFYRRIAEQEAMTVLDIRVDPAVGDAVASGGPLGALVCERFADSARIERPLAVPAGCNGRVLLVPNLVREDLAVSPQVLLTLETPFSPAVVAAALRAPAAAAVRVADPAPAPAAVPAAAPAPVPAAIRAPAWSFVRPAAVGDLMAAKSECSAKLLLSEAARKVRKRAKTAETHPAFNLAGIGIGEKYTGGKPTGTPAVLFLVKKKHKGPKSALTRTHHLPENWAGLPTDVVETGAFSIRPFSRRRRRRGGKQSFGPTGTCSVAAGTDPRTHLRPMVPGATVGVIDFQEVNSLTGTLGCLVRDAAGRLHLLSNSHVLADQGRLEEGASVFAPGLDFGGDMNTDRVAALRAFLPLDLTPGALNDADCALAAIDEGIVSSPAILLLGVPTGEGAAAHGMLVRKFGACSCLTEGRVLSPSTDAVVGGYDDGTPDGELTFRNQITVQGTTGRFTEKGDSGSAVLGPDGSVVGLHVGVAAAGFSVVNPIRAVLDGLGAAVGSELHVVRAGG